MRPLLLLLLAVPAFSADDPAPALVQNIKELRKSVQDGRTRDGVRLAPVSTQLTVVDPWTDATRQHFERQAGPPSTTLAVVEGVVLASPIDPLLAPVMDPFSSADAERIASGCKRSFPEPWDRIGCVSRGVHDFVSTFTFDGLRSPCRSYAQAFHRTFDALGLGGAFASKVNASGSLADGAHVANLVTVTDAEGRTYSYVIDVGGIPGDLFPENEFAMRFHDPAGSGKTSFSRLPAISANPEYSFKPAP